MVSGLLARWRSWLPVVSTFWAIGWLWGEPLALITVVPLSTVGIFVAVRRPLPGAVVVLLAQIAVQRVGAEYDNPAVLLAGVAANFLLGYAVEFRFGVVVQVLYVAAILSGDLPLAGLAIGVGAQLAVWALGLNVRRASLAASEARSRARAWQDVDDDGHLRLIVDRERRRMEWQILAALDESVGEMRSVALTTTPLDVAALRRLRDLAQTTIEDLRSLLLSLRSTRPPEQAVNTGSPLRRWRREAAVGLGVVVLAAVDAVLVGRAIPDASALSWIGLLCIVVLPWRHTAPVLACVVATLPYLVAHLTETELVFGAATLVTLGLLTWSSVAERERAAVAAGALLCVAVMVAPTHPVTLYPLVTGSLIAFAAVASVAWHQFRRDRERELTLLQESEAALMMRAGPELIEIRRALARDLHDAVSRTVGVIAIQAEAAIALADIDPTRSRQSARIVADAAIRSDAELTGLRRILRDAATDAPTPLARTLADAESLGLRVDARLETTLNDVPIATAAYQLIAEALANAAKYAPGAHVLIRLWREDDGFRLSIVDDGGSTPSSHPPGTGFGLLSQTERVEQLGGRMWTSQEGDGFAVHAMIPRERPTGAAPELTRVSE